METVPDRAAQEGFPRDDMPGPVTEIQTTLDGRHMVKYAAFLVTAVGLMVAILGAITSVVPILIAGAAILAAGVLFMLWYFGTRAWRGHHAPSPR